MFIGRHGYISSYPLEMLYLASIINAFHSQLSKLSHSKHNLKYNIWDLKKCKANFLRLYTFSVRANLTISIFF